MDCKNPNPADLPILNEVKILLQDPDNNIGRIKLLIKKLQPHTPVNMAAEIIWKEKPINNVVTHRKVIEVIFRPVS